MARWLRQQVNLFFAALQFLTRIPVSSRMDFHADLLAQSVRFFPLVGALVGLLNALVWWLCGHWFPHGVAVALMLAASLLITGALHEDGFADVCDGFGGGATREKILAIMQDSRVGAYGAMGSAMLLLVKWTTLNALPAGGFALVLVTAHMVSRWQAIALVWRLPYLRAATDGKAKALANRLSGGQWACSGLIGIAPLAVMIFMSSSMPLLKTLGAGFVFSLLWLLLAGWYCKARLDGYTGDCLGATQQITETAFFLGVLAALQSV